MAHAVGVFDSEPTLNSVSMVTGMRADRSAKPKPLVQTTSPSRISATAAPGTEYVLSASGRVDSIFVIKARVGRLSDKAA